MTSVAYAYDGTLEGLLTAIFVAYRDKQEPDDIVEEKYLQLKLNQTLVPIFTEEELAFRVQKGIYRFCGQAAFDAIKSAFLSCDPQAGTIIYQFVRYAMAAHEPHDCSGCPRKARCSGLCVLPQKKSVLNNVTHPAVEALQRLNKTVYNERHHMMQFIRFEHLENSIWFAKCNPKCSVIPLIMDWFSNRFNTQPFIIYDENHELAGVYEGKEWYLVQTSTLDLPQQAHDETIMSTAWKRFYDTVAVESRYNPELRRSFMPKRLWKNILEVQETIPGRGSDKELATTSTIRNRRPQ